MLTSDQIQARIDTMDTCTLKQILTYLSNGTYKLTSDYDLATLQGLIKMEITSRLTGGITIDQLCPGAIMLSNPEAIQFIYDVTGSSIILPLPPIYQTKPPIFVDPALVDTIIPGTVLTPVTTVPSINSGINWWQIGVFGLLIYIFIKKT